jgi:hypothetical protein
MRGGVRADAVLVLVLVIFGFGFPVCREELRLHRPLLDLSHCFFQ